MQTPALSSDEPVSLASVLELRPGPISRTSLALFAGGSGDQNPIHIDIDAARRAGFEDVIVPGMMPAAYVARLLCETFGQERLRELQFRFTEITPVNAAPTCRAVVTGMTEDQWELELDVELQDGTKTLIGTAVVSR